MDSVNTTLRSDAIASILRHKIQLSLTSYMYENAIFLAERLVAQQPIEEARTLLATCYYYAGQLNVAIAILENVELPESRYLLAVCALQVGNLKIAENALIGERSDLYDSSDTEDEKIPNGAAGLYLLGRICRRANRHKQAIYYFKKSLAMDPSLWCAYEELCDLGDPIPTEEAFPISYDEVKSENPQDKHLGTETPKLESGKLNLTGAIPTSKLLVTPNNSYSRSNVLTSIKQNTSFRTPDASHHKASTIIKRSRNSSDKDISNTSASAAENLNPTNSHSRSLSTPPRHPRMRKYRRMFAPPDGTEHSHGQSHSNTLSNDEVRSSTKKKLSFASITTEDLSPNTAVGLFQDKSEPHDDKHHSKDLSHSTIDCDLDNSGSTIELYKLLQQFGDIYRCLSVYECTEVLQLAANLPSQHKNCGWASQHIGRAYFELGEYEKAREAFKQMHQREPYRLSGLEVYSTTLWHLKKDVELSYLAQSVTTFDKLSCQAWCIAGNCFSLQKEHDTALKFFQRAIQLNPAFTYAYTLSGHEYAAKEDFDKAIDCFRHAIRLDPRHYNAWYGLGTIYYRQEKFEFAEYHFSQALEINPRSTLLYVFLGMVLNAMQQTNQALHVLGLAAELQPMNAQVRFQRANVLLSLKKFDEAMGELNFVKEIAPRESSVYFMMGKVAKARGQLDDALTHFTTALYFHPKDNSLIKTEIEKLFDDGTLEDEDNNVLNE